MTAKEIYSMKGKNSQEILFYLQTKIINKKKLNSNTLPAKKENKIIIKENNESLPPTRMKQFINNPTMNNAPKISTSSVSKETKELTAKNSTPKFRKTKSPIRIEINKNYSQFSFSENEINKNSVSYLDFHLHENINYKGNKNEDILHIYLPKKYKDDENYKVNLYKYLKVKAKEDNIVYNKNKGIKTKIIEPKNILSKFDKRKKPYSVQKKSLNKITFFDNNNHEDIFNLYKDEYIGIDRDWQLPIIYQKYDNDIESDEEQISKGKAKMLYDLRLGIIKWSQNKNSCYNYRYIKCPMKTEYIKGCNASI